VLRGEEIRQLPPGRALVVAENAPPLIARLDRCISGRAGQALLAAQAAARARVTAAREAAAGSGARTGPVHAAAAAQAPVAPSGGRTW
jgi:type IV secretion system protein VirD4